MKYKNTLVIIDWRRNNREISYLNLISFQKSRPNKISGKARVGISSSHDVEH